MRFLISSFILFFSLTGWSQESFFDEQVKPGLLRATDSTSLYLVTGGVLSVGIARPYDDSTYEKWKDHKVWSRETSKWGDHYGEYGISAFIALGQIYFDRENGFNSARVLIANSLLTTTMKLSFARQRPNDGNYRSFPSGHTSDAFAMATSLSYAYGWKIGIIAFPAATYVAFSRLADEAHWLSDITAGAFVGVWMGRSFFYSPEKESQSANWQVYPQITSKNQSIQISGTF